MAVVLLAGCQTNDFELAKRPTPSDDESAHKSIPLEKITSNQRKLAAEGVSFLDKAEYEKASKSFNKALKLDIENSYLQFLNGLSYHLLALRGNASMFPLAAKGYELAIQFDPSNWIAHYHLGLLYLDQRKFVPAQEKFSEAALFIDDDPDIFYSLAVASYYAQDPVTAAGALERARQLDPQNENVLRASSLIMAALGEQGKATEFKDHYIKATAAAPKAKRLSRRLMDWQRFHSRQGRVFLAQKMEAVPVIAVESQPLPSVAMAKMKEQAAQEALRKTEAAKAALEAMKVEAAAAIGAASEALSAAKAKAAATTRAAKTVLKAAEERESFLAQEAEAALKAAEAREVAALKAADDAIAAADKAADEDAPIEVLDAADKLVEETALATDKVAEEIEAIEEAAEQAQEKAAEALEAAEEKATVVEEEGLEAIEIAEEKAATVEEEMSAAVEAAEEKVAEATETAEMAVEAATEAADVATEDMAQADEVEKEKAAADAEAAAERASAAVDLASTAAQEANAAAEKAAEIAESEPAAAEQATAAQHSAAEAGAAFEVATAASEKAAVKAEATASAEKAVAARAAAVETQTAAGRAVTAANKALDAAEVAMGILAAAKSVVADIAFFKDAETEEDQEEPVTDENKMAIVDVVIIRTEEDNTTSKGVNLLSGLTLQFGGGLVTTSAYGVSDINEIPSAGGVTRTITRAINIPSITYSLNIANAATERNEILARPTLVALAGQESEFFSGIKIQASAIGGAADTGSTVSIEDEIGVRLKVTPEFLEDGRIKLSVEAERTFLATPNTTSITYEFRVDTSKTNVVANVAMNFGETLILSGLSEKETERVSSGVPFLQDVPGLQYFFSNRTTRDFQKSVLILLTPRSPNYIHQSEKGRKQSRQKMGKDERVLSELQARYSDWFKPYPNWASVFNHLQANSLYREFRTGDVNMEKWENQEGYKARLKKALEFLYH